MAGYNYSYNSTQTTSNSMVVFIADDTMASTYPVAPNTTVALINVNDSANGKMYIKSTEPNGMPNTTRVFALKEITPTKTTTDSVSRQEFDNLSEQMIEIKQMLEGLTKKGENKQ